MISEKIEKIIDRRIGRGAYAGKGHLDCVQKQMDFLLILKEKVESFMAFRQSVLQQLTAHSGEYFAIAKEDPTFEEKVRLADPSKLLDKIYMAIAECERLKTRFSRESINISVIGLARQGKSTLLQSITQLPDTIIPAAAGGDCTGAKSVISNLKGSKTYAEITFYSEYEMLTQVQKYLDELGLGVVLGSLGQLKNLDLSAIPSGYSASKASLKIHLRKYIDHLDEYRDQLGKKITIFDENEIRKYVAQYGVDGKPTFQYLAVKEVHIYTQFHYAEAGNITLVDTIGVGDTSLGIKDKMMATLVNDSDAAVLIRRPDKDGDSVKEWDNDLLELICNNMQGLELDKWLFYIINEYSENKMAAESLYKGLQGQKEDGALNVADMLRVNCKDPEEVEQKIVLSILKNLSENLEGIDSGLLKRANECLSDVYHTFFELCNKIRNVLNNSFRRNLNAGGLFDKLFRNLPMFAKLRDLEHMYMASKDENCLDIQNSIISVLRTISEACPDKDEILEQLRIGTQESQPDVVYNHCSDNLRATIAERLESANDRTLTELQEKVKTDVIEILYSDEGGALGKIPLSDNSVKTPSSEWLKAFIEEKLTNWPLMKEAFRYILDYRLNIEGSLEYKVICSLEYLDPTSKKFCKIDTRGRDDDENAEVMEQSFLNAINIAADDLLSSLTDIMVIPGNLSFAKIRKFREKLAYSDEGLEELKEFYRENCAVVWKEEFSRIRGVQSAFGAWTDYEAEFSKMCKNDSFTVKIV